MGTKDEENEMSKARLLEAIKNPQVTMEDEDYDLAVYVLKILGTSCRI